jgi:hypothetical protein
MKVLSIDFTKNPFIIYYDRCVDNYYNIWQAIYLNASVHY